MPSLFFFTPLIFRMSGLQDGDVVCDPMCGGSSIPIEVRSTCIRLRFKRYSQI